MDENIFDFTVVIEQDEDGIYVANVPGLERCYTQGKTLQTVLERIREAIEIKRNLHILMWGLVEPRKAFISKTH